MKLPLLCLALLFPSCAAGAAAPSGDFALAELDLGPDCRLPEGTWREAFDFIRRNTSVEPDNEVLRLSPDAPLLYYRPFLTLSCGKAPRALAYQEIAALRLYIAGGGTLLLNNSSGARRGSFEAWAGRLAGLLLPGAALEPLPAGHPLFKSFFLARGRGGRFDVQAAPEAAFYAGRAAILYSANDLAGIWPVSPAGAPVYPCLPGGEAQRLEGRRLFLNMVMYSLTGSYKEDAVHQPFLLEKMRRLAAGAAEELP
ncbi:MAG: hypothetical protein FD189_2077 [Elusimicrobia bacterium]|nr:MAG: hypothetical protein FD154_1779 [Elusimicrobiota bacterium]KAF0154127.1 MAG: hypothetical protein FD189_2077 [Elusimicrobiota bacterium]